MQPETTADQRAGSWVDGDRAIVYQRCGVCENIWYFHRAFCPNCGDGDPGTFTASGNGCVYATSMVHRAPSDALRRHAPYLIVMVDADEGFRLMAHGDPSLAIGDRVRARFIEFGGKIIPRFGKPDG
ncbi:MAG TPA: OB-fold domain-containing protein [Burkholderiales bacterium]|nr:OB-fold domain-containing protein [Burkholderiales bacterium]